MEWTQLIDFKKEKSNNPCLVAQLGRRLDHIAICDRAGFELLQLLRLKARAHYAQAIADTGTDLTVKSPIRHRTDRLRQALRDLIQAAQGAQSQWRRSDSRFGMKKAAKPVHVRAGTAFILTRKLRRKRRACPTFSYPAL